MRAFLIFFILPLGACNPDTEPPNKLTVDTAGRVLQSTAYWAGGAEQESWLCERAPQGFDLVVIDTETVDLGRRRGACTGGRSHCDSAGEFCHDERIVKGCLINSEWHDWYRRETEKTQMPYTKEAVCRPQS